VTKLDLGCSAEFRQAIGDYQRAGYALSKSPQKVVRGLDDLHLALKAEVSMLVGESGVGKSTLTMQLARQ